MTDESGQAPLDDETIAFAGRVFALARSGETDALSELLQGGLPPDLSNDKGDSLLMLASYHGHVDLSRLLMRHGADPNRTNDRGQTPLAGAAFKGDLVIARLLLDEGAEVDARDPGGRTALMVAGMFDRIDLVDLLLERGADPAIRDAAGLTAADVAKAMGAAQTPARLAQAPERPADPWGAFGGGVDRLVSSLFTPARCCRR